MPRGETLTGTGVPEPCSKVKAGDPRRKAHAAARARDAGASKSRDPMRAEPLVEVFVFEDPCEALGERWSAPTDGFSDYLGTRVPPRAHGQRDCRRAVTAKSTGWPAGRRGELRRRVSAPAHHRGLTRRSQPPCPRSRWTMQRFRPNLVVLGTRPCPTTRTTGAGCGSAASSSTARRPAGAVSSPPSIRRTESPRRAPGTPAYTLHVPPPRRRWPGLRHPPHPSRRRESSEVGADGVEVVARGCSAAVVVLVRRPSHSTRA